VRCDFYWYILDHLKHSYNHKLHLPPTSQPHKSAFGVRAASPPQPNTLELRLSYAFPTDMARAASALGHRPECDRSAVFAAMRAVLRGLVEVFAASASSRCARRNVRWGACRWWR